MTLLLVLYSLITAFMIGVCFGSFLVEDDGVELRLPSGWWILPCAALGGLLAAMLIVAAF